MKKLIALSLVAFLPTLLQASEADLKVPLEIHEFGMLKFVGIMIITVLAMAVVVFVAFMVGILITQMITFIGTIIQEIRYR